MTLRSEFFRNWAIVCLGFLTLSLAFSSRQILGLAMPVWEVDPGWSRSFVSSGGALALVTMAVVSPFAGNLIDRHGPRLLLSGGCFLIFSGLIIVAMADSRWVFLAGFSGLAAIGFGAVATHVVATAIALRFPEGRRGLATGIGTAGATAGQFVIVPLAALLLQTTDWRLATAALATACAAVGLLAFIGLGRGGAPARAEGQRAEALGSRLRFLLRNPVFHVLFWSFLLCGFTTSGVIETHFLPYAVACGFPPLPGATAYGVLSGVNLVGMILSGWLTDRVNRPLLLGGIYIARACCFVLLMQVADSYPTLILFAVLFGLFDYSTIPVTASLAASHLGVRVMGLAMGLISAGHAVGGAAGAFLGGWLFDHFARYDWVWIAAVGLAGLAGLLALTLRERASVRAAG